MFLKYIFPLFIFITLFFSAQVCAQEKSDLIIKPENTDSLTYSLQDSSKSVWEPCISPFIELLGKGFLSVNVDFRRKESHAISIGLQPFEGLAPNIMYYYLSGKRHRFELGGGFSGGFANDFSLEVVLIHGVVGYRYQKKKGLFFRVGFTPFYVIFLNDKDRGNKLYPFAGLSLGYSF